MSGTLNVRDVVSAGKAAQEQSIDTRKPSHLSWVFDTSATAYYGFT